MLVPQTVELHDRHFWYLQEFYTFICPLRLAGPVLDRLLDYYLLAQLSNSSSVMQPTYVMEPLVCILHSDLSLQAAFCGTVNGWSHLNASCMQAGHSCMRQRAGSLAYSGQTACSYMVRQAAARQL